MIKIIKYLTILYLILVGCISCTTKNNFQWIESNNGTLLWLSSSDTIKEFLWEGDVIDNVANGTGVLSSFDKNGEKISRKLDMYYGLSSMEEIVILKDGGEYIGNIVDGKMEGFGVLLKGNDCYIGSFHEGKPEGFLKLYKDRKLYYEGYWKSGNFNGEGTLYKEDGSIRIGEWVDNKLSQTYTKMQIPQGSYKGYVKNNKPDGLGELTYANGSLYQGKWKNGLWDGEGLYISKNDSVYGIWKEGKVCGDVIYRTPDLFYEGTFLDNAPIGAGILAQSDGSYYSGYWLDGKRNGTGDMIFANGDSYMGEWNENKFEGFGVYKYVSENSVYRGNWVDGLQHGIGFYESPKFSYNGQWDQGWMDGDGVLVFENGDRYEGTIHENIIDGIGCYDFVNGNRYEGEFINGKLNGLGVFQFKNGDRFEGEFYDGKIYGDGTIYLVSEKGVVSITGFWPKDGSYPKEASIIFENGDIYEGPLINGIPSQDGMWVSGKERQEGLDKVNNSAIHKANELYKKHRETINWCLVGISTAVTTIEVACASTVIAMPAAAVLHGINVAVNVVDASMAIASAGIDVIENRQLGEDNTEAIRHLGAEVAMNAAFVVVPKVAKSVVKPLETGVKNVTRSPIAEHILKGNRNLIKQSALKLNKGKINGKVIKLAVAKEGRKVEKKLIQGKITQKPMIAIGRLLTRKKDQMVSYSSYLKLIKKNPNLKNELQFSVDGNSKFLGGNMRLCGTDKWVHKNERIRRYLKMRKRQVEPHHIIPSNPTTKEGIRARKIWVEYFGSVDHPCNGIWLGRTNKKLGYKALAKGSNHSPNSDMYERTVSQEIWKTYKKYQKRYANNPEMMQLKLVETVDNIKGQLYNGHLAIGTNSHTIHTSISIFSEKNTSNVVSEAAKNTSQLISSLNKNNYEYLPVSI